MGKWALPEYIEDILPPEAERLESTRRLLLDHFRRHGYLLVQPPLLEHLDSLLTGTGRDLELQTFKVVDQLSGRLLGLRADITPQVARIDAHLFEHSGVTRLCYCGSVTRTLPAGPHSTREVIQLGAELYGHAGIESDAEVLGMLVSGVRATGVGPLHLDLSHVGVYRALASAAGLADEPEADLMEALRAKDTAAIGELSAAVASPWREAFAALPALYGAAAAVGGRARRMLPSAPGITAALDDLDRLAQKLGNAVDRLHIDLADLRGYHYHTGLTFALFTPGDTNPVGLGGRYDGIGRAFGSGRPATGFTVYLRQLAGLLPDPDPPSAIGAPADADPALASVVARLREDGETVVCTLPDEAASRRFPRRLERQDGRWVVVKTTQP